MAPGPGNWVPMTAEMRPAVKTPGAMGSPKLVAAAYAGSLWIGLKSPTASMNSAIASISTCRSISA